MAEPLDNKENPAFLQLEARLGLTLKQIRPKASQFKGQTAFRPARSNEPLRFDT
jgi:hypothetical protein